ncbi:cation (Na+-coupled) multidrug resistance efflux pump [Aeromonas diversa CDC 2478-85]|uniref:Cation (Na+-coupled) multidrug resistance efflux pump n=1 Tax=Aeromonas diversa CDC 2478-85 TaxID=1268237 RepID=N9VBA8_9GAMM|nr:MATE family efflux transporter [Aeromonas diversa]ENY72532.1 cation (Na+-coupled) multidrug resistance efflux pump [Aeromonas diversa CDC 2478-85]
MSTLNPSALRRRFWHYALPSVLAMIVPASYYLVDGIFVGHFVGAAGLAAVNLVYPIIMVLIGLAAMIAMGAATRISLHLGAHRTKEARHALVSCLWLLLLLGLLAPLAIVPFLDHWLGLLGLTPEHPAWSHARDYLAWIGGGALLLGTNLAIPYLLRNDDRPRLAMALTMLGGLLNIGFNTLFVVWLDLGLVGAAQAILLTEAIVTVLGFGYFFSRHARLRLHLGDLRPRRRGTGTLLLAGAPTLVAELNVGVLLFLHNTQLLAYGGVHDVAGYTVAGYMEAIFVVILQGLAFGIQPLVGQAVGAGRRHEVRFLMKMALRVTLGYGLLMWGLIHLFPQQVALAFLGDGDPAVLAAAVSSLTINLMAMPLEGLELMGIVLLQAMDRPRPALALTVTKTVLLIPLIVGLPLLFGLKGVLLAQPTTVAVLATPLLFLLWREWLALRQPSPRPLPAH